MEPQSTNCVSPPPSESPPQSLDSPDSDSTDAQVAKLSIRQDNFKEETVTIALDSITITFKSSLVRLGYFEVLSVNCEKKAPVVETGDILREFQGADMRVDSERLKQMFTEEIAASVILVFEKKKWAGTLLRLSFKVLTSPLRIETVPEWVDDEPPPPRTVSQIARELLSHFHAPLHCSGTVELVDTTCFSDEEWKTAMLKFARVLQNAQLEEARLALCEAITVLFLHQNKSLSSALPKSDESKVDLGPKIVLDNQQASAIERDSLDLASTDIIPSQKSMKPKTLLELAQGDFDLLDEPTPSNSALENTHIEIECIVDEALAQHKLVRINSTEKQGLSSDHPRHSQSEQHSVLGLMPIPLHFRLSSFSSPADTPRPQVFLQPLQIVSNDNAPKSQGMYFKTQSPKEFQQVSPQTSQFNDDNKNDLEKKVMHHHAMNQATLFSSPSQSQRQTHNLDATLIPSRQVTPVEAAFSASLKSESPLVASPKSTAATDAAEKAARMAHSMKANIGAQARLSQFQAVQAAAVQKTVADTEHKNSTKVLESAYMHKVEEAAVLRRECLKLQEMIGTLQLNMNLPAGNSQNDVRESSEQTEAEPVDVQSKKIDMEIVHMSRKQLLVSSLQSFSLSSEEQPFEA